MCVYDITCSISHRSWEMQVSTLAVTIIFQPAAPILTPLATLGLLARYWCEKSSMLRGASAPGLQKGKTKAIRYDKVTQ